VKADNAKGHVGLSGNLANADRIKAPFGKATFGGIKHPLAGNLASGDAPVFACPVFPSVSHDSTAPSVRSYGLLICILRSLAVSEYALRLLLLVASCCFTNAINVPAFQVVKSEFGSA